MLNLKDLTPDFSAAAIHQAHSISADFEPAAAPKPRVVVSRDYMPNLNFDD